MSSAEAEIYSATSVTSDAVLMFHRIKFAVGEGTTIEVRLAMDNSAGRSFFGRIGVGRIRHISLRVLWVQAKVKEGFMQVGKVSTKDNVSDLGTKRLSRDRMEYLMFLCKVYNMAESQMVGSSLADKIEEQNAMRVGIKMFKQVGMSSATSKSLMHVVLLNALSLGVAMDSKTMGFSCLPSNGFEVHELYKLLVACACTFVCMLLGFLWVTAYHGSQLQQRLHRLRVDFNLRKVLEILKIAWRKNSCEGGEEEQKTEDPVVNPDEGESSDELECERDRYAMYQQSRLEKVSDDEFWRYIHHGKPDGDEGASAHRTYSNAHMESVMRETNDLLNARIRRLRREYENAELVNAMESITDQIHEAAHLRYNI